MQLRTRNIYLLAFVASGFSGLIYDSVWTHYLKLYLGHAAYAQTLVLAIFMGGIAAGSLVASRVTERWTGPLKLYAGWKGPSAFSTCCSINCLWQSPLFPLTPSFLR